MFAYGIGAVVAGAVIVAIIAWMARELTRQARELSALNRVRRNPLYREQLEDVQARNVRIVNLLRLAYRDFSEAMSEVDNVPQS